MFGSFFVKGSTETSTLGTPMSVTVRLRTNGGFWMNWTRRRAVATKPSTIA
jgi:hypothetical protein